MDDSALFRGQSWLPSPLDANPADHKSLQMISVSGDQSIDLRQADNTHKGQ